MRRLLALGISAATFAFWQGLAPCAAQVKLAPVPQEVREEAQRSLPGVRQMVTPETYKRLGFESIEEASSAELGSPMRIFMVGLDRLKEFAPSRSPSEHLVDTNEVRYPVTVGGNVRTSMVMHLIEGKWQLARVGRPALTKGLVEAARKQAAPPGAAQEPSFEVQIPALNLYFTGQQAGPRLLLTPVLDDERFGFKQGETLDAQQVFAKIAPYAKQVQTGPYLSD